MFSKGNKGYVIKKYDSQGKPFFDFITQKDGKLYNKFNTDAKYVDNQIHKTAENVSLGGSLLEPTGAGYIRPAQDNNIIPNQRIVVNRNLPRLSDYMEGLADSQKDALTKALNEGAYKSINAKGSLGATHRGLEVLNDMINESYDTSSIIGQRIARTDTRLLMEVKDRLNQILAPSGIKPYDIGISKAKALQSNFEKGYKFNPSEVKFEALDLKTARDRRAFLQGRIAKILDNVKDTKSVATAIKNDENTLKKLMPENKFNKLIRDVNENEIQFKRMQDLTNRASHKIVRPEPADRPLSERGETKGAVLGSIADKIKALLLTNGSEKAAQRLLNGTGTLNGIPRLERIGKISSDGSLTPYFVELLSR